MIRVQADHEGNMTTSNPEVPQAREENTSAPTPEPVVRFGGVRTRYDSATGQMTILSDGQDPRSRYQSGADRPGDPLDSARSQQGSPVARMNLGLDDIVDYGGTTRVRELVNMGVLVKDASGVFKWASGTEPAGVTAPLAQQEAEAVAAESGENEPISAEGIPGTSAAADVFMDTTRQSVGDTVFTGTLTAVIQGHDLTPFVAEISRRTQQPEHEIREGIETARGEFERAGRAIALRAGVGNRAYNDFLAWATENRPDEALEAGLALAQQKDVTGFTKLARQYARTGRQETAGISDADLLGASFGNGIKARQTSDGVVLDIPNHGSMSFKMAVASGLIKVSRGR